MKAGPFPFSRFLFLSLCSIITAKGFALESLSQHGKYLEQLKKIPGTIDINDGVFTISDKLTIQANKFCSSDTEEDGFVLSASGNIMVSYNCHTFVCEEFEYRDRTKEAILQKGKFAVFPWFIGGETICISDKGVKIIKGYVSTSEGPKKDVLITTPIVSLSPNNTLSVHGGCVTVKQIPILFFPGFSFNPTKLKRPPLSLRGGRGGFLGSYLGLSYTPYSSENYCATLISDYFFKHGIGLGGNFHYRNNEHDFITLKNYYAHNLSLNTPKEQDRYHLKGRFSFKSKHEYPLILEGCHHAADSWETTADLSSEHFSIPNTGPTEFSLRGSSKSTHFIIRTRLKINDFQSVDQEIPYGFIHYKTAGANNRLFFDNQAEIGYQDYSFSNNISGAKSFSCLRASLHNQIYTVISSKLGTLHPKIGLKSIYYGKSPITDSPQQQFVGNYSLDYRLTFMKRLPSGKHFLEPYISYRGLTHPSLAHDEHFIFSVEDAFHTLNAIKSGFSSILLNSSGKSILDLNVGAFSLYDNKSMQELFPKIYFKGILSPTPRSTFNVDTVWIPKKSTWDYWNIVWKWSPGKHFALSSEFLYRSQYNWLKADHSNFVLDVSHTEAELLGSPLSKERTVFMSKVFLRLSPGVNYKLLLRHGYNQKNLPGYSEYQMTLSTKIFEHWRLETVYECRESDKRMYFLLQLD